MQRTAVALTAEEAIALLEPGDVVIDCTGTRSLLRERVVPDAGEGDGNEVFPDLVGPQLDALGRRAERLSFAAGDTIIAEGDPADRFFVVVGGEVEISRRSAEGEEVKLAKLGRSRFFGEIGILAETHRTATVRAVGDVELMALTWQEFQETLERSDRAERDFAEIARERLAHATSVAGDSGVRRP